MNPQDKAAAYLRAVDERDAEATIFAPLTDTMFAACAAGKKWLSEATLEDQIAAAERCGYSASFVQGSTPDLTVNPALTGLVETEQTGDGAEERRFRQTIRTPHGDLVRDLVEQPERGITATREWVQSPGQFPCAEWICEEILAGNRDEAIRGYYRDFVTKTNRFGVTQVQMELPYFMFGLPGLSTGPVMFCMDEDSGYGELMKLGERALLHVSDLLLAAGVDFVWIGAGGTELLSPSLWEEIIVPQSRRITRYVHERGGRVHFHCCGQSALWVEKGYFNEIGMDVLETLSPPPAGTIENLAEARAALDKAIVTRGNIDLELIRSGTPAECARAVRQVLDDTKGFPHLVGAADAILYGTSEENLRAMVEACGA